MTSKHAKPTTVLVVEDEPTVRTLAECIIEALGSYGKNLVTA
jgi:hypothetical protein